MRWNHNDTVDRWGGRIESEGQGGELTNSIFNTTMKWEMGETTVGAIPDFDNGSRVDVLNDKI